jgi:hypothetical protein
MFLDTLKQVSAKQFISIDESGIHKKMSLSHGYACKGTRLLKQTTSQRYQNYSLVMAVSCERVVAYTILKGATNKDAFLVFLKEHLIPACSSSKYIFLLDNVTTPLHQRRSGVALAYPQGATPLALHMEERTTMRVRAWWCTANEGGLLRESVFTWCTKLHISLVNGSYQRCGC